MNKILYFTKCIWKFAFTFWNYPYWDYTFILKNMKNSTELMLESYIKNERIDTENLQRVIELLDNVINDVHYEQCTDKNNPKLVKKILKKEERDWEELFEKLKTMRNWWA